MSDWIKYALTLVLGLVLSAAVAWVKGYFDRRRELMKLAVEIGMKAFEMDRHQRTHSRPFPASFYIFFHYEFLHLVERKGVTSDSIKAIHERQKMLLQAVRHGPWAEGLAVEVPPDSLAPARP